MATKVAINGFGRIGRNVARAILERTDHDLELVSINDLASPKANAMLFQRDSVHGPFSGRVAGSRSAGTWMRLPLITRSLPSTSSVPTSCTQNL